MVFFLSIRGEDIRTDVLSSMNLRRKISYFFVLLCKKKMFSSFGGWVSLLQSYLYDIKE